LPVDIIERTLIEKGREPALIMAKSLNFRQPTTMALLFLGAHGRLRGRLRLEHHLWRRNSCFVQDGAS